MSDGRMGSGWQPLSKPNLTRPNLTPTRPGAAGPPGPPRDGSKRLNRNGSPLVSAFVRLARTHAFHAAGETAVVVALAGTFIALDPNDARPRILLALLLTMAPFSVVGPLIGPALDRVRGGRRVTITVTLVVRAALMVLMLRNIDTVWFFPTAFAWLVMGKTYSVAKAATVPTTVSNDDELVDKNSRLAVLSAVAGGAGGAVAWLLEWIFGSTVTLSYAAIIYVIGAIVSLQMPRVVVDDPETTDDDIDIRSAGVRLASWAMAMLRGIVGFVTWLLVFEFVRSDLPDLSGVGTAVGAAVKAAMGFDLVQDPGPPRWKVAIPFALLGVGGFVGNLIAPRLRKRFSEENMILGAILTMAIAAIAAVWAGGLSGAALLALVVGAAPSAAKLAFDALVQRDAPGANHGAAFGRFETRFQIAWVVGSLLAVVVLFPLRAGFLVVALLAAAAAVVMTQQGSRSGLSFGRTGRAPRRRQPRADPAPDVARPNDAQRTPDVGRPAPGLGATTSGAASADPYAEAFAQTAVEPPDWAAAVFGETEPADDLAPPEWLAEAQSADTEDDASYTELDSTPPMGTPIDPNL